MTINKDMLGNKQLPPLHQSGMEDAYEEAIKVTREQLAKLNIEEQCHKGGAQYLEMDSQKTIVIKYLSQPYEVSLPNFEISLIDSKEKVHVRDKILILRYLVQAKGSPPANRLITMKELPDGRNYSRTFSQRAIKPVLDHFGNEPNQLIDVATKLGGYKVEYGDAAVTINAFSRVPITIALWHGDEEFAPTGSIMFDASISDYLSCYDITVLCETIAWRLVKYLREAKKFAPRLKG